MNYSIKTKGGDTLTIASNPEDCVESLFTKGGTVTNYITKRGKRFVDLTILGENYRLNASGVFCLVTIQGGKPWYSYGGQFNEITELNAQHDLAKALLAAK